LYTVAKTFDDILGSGWHNKGVGRNYLIIL